MATSAKAPTAPAMQVPLLDLKPQYQPLAAEIQAAIARVCASQHFILGAAVKELEAAVATYSQCRYGIGVYNVKGKFYAIANHCPHEGGPLCQGRQGGRTIVDENAVGGASLVRDGEWIYCPWHQWGIELATGTTAVKPEWSVRTYPVKIVDGKIVVVR